MKLIHGDCVEVLPTLDSASVDCVITDPPYPEIDRDYGRMTEADWHAMMDVVVPECRRILKPTGSAVFILQPNSERVGRMRPWLWEFMAKWTREWGMVQDAWWWNNNILPNGGVQFGLMRRSVKACVWLGNATAFRDQSKVLKELDQNIARRLAAETSNDSVRYPSGNQVRRRKCYETAIERGGSSPFNLLQFGHGGKKELVARCGHGAGTPIGLADWWLRYICPPGGTVLDPFVGSGTVALAALARGCDAIGIERMGKYHAVAQNRIQAAQAERAELLIA